jgi:hypothetical protein
MANPSVARSSKKYQAESVIVKIPFSKCDQFGKSRDILHVRQPRGSRCIVHDLEEGIIATRIDLHATDKDYLFLVKGRAVISAEQVSVVMKRTVEFADLAVQRFLHIHCVMAEPRCWQQPVYRNT